MPGLYGKLPARGDFIQRDLPRAFLDAWDDWLQQALSRSREHLGEGWLRHYLNSPVWRFVLSAGSCGSQPMAGLMMPSVDRVGRYFPLTLALPLPRGADPLALLREGGHWFEQAEQLLLEALADDLELDRFIERVQSLGTPACPVAPASMAAGGQRWFCSLDSLARLPECLDGLLRPLLAQIFPRFTLWWSHGSQQIEPCLLVSAGLPPPAAFTALLAGDWDRYDWVVLRPPAPVVPVDSVQ